MSILSKEEILKAIKKKRIIIEPFNPENIGPGSVDLTLDDEFRIFKKSKKVLDYKTDSKSISKVVKKKSIILKPGDFILGITKEKITLSPNLAGFVEGRSSLARLGLTAHITAPFMPPGISNREVLEIKNLGNNSIRLEAGMKICQFIFEDVKGKAVYEGKYSKQEKI